jgi:hypothetical protein
MTSQIGVSCYLTQMPARKAASVFVGVATILLSAIGGASAGEGAAQNVYSERGMLDAARGAAQQGDHSVNIGLPPPDELRVLEARREAELQRLSDKLKRAEARVAAQKPGSPSEWATDVAAAPTLEIDTNERSALGAMGGDQSRDTEAAETRGKATIVLVMAPRGARSYDTASVADPILCLTDGCYVSNGPQAPATYHSLHESVGFAGRIGRGAGACNGALSCVYRNVTVGSTVAMVQPIDLRRVHHDRREQAEITIDDTCRLIDARLSCSRPVRTETYTLWVVPESLARTIGPERLAQAAEEGLRTSRSAELPWAKN